ncbi:MAG: hypothetical protein QM680_11620 [Luteolibacter sp.]
MRGSPLIRFFFIALALVATGFGLLRVTAAKTAEVSPTPTVSKSEKNTAEIPYRLQLSAPASAVEISTGISQTADLSGKLTLDSANPQVFLIVKWQNPPAAGELRFAKLTLEPAGQPTLTHTFDASGDIDDLLELPLPAGK